MERGNSLRGSPKKYCPVWLAVFGLALSGLSGAAKGAQEPTAEEIVAHSVARAESQRESESDLDYTATIRTTRQRLDGDGEVEEEETETHRQYAFEGVLFEELVAEDGEPLDADGLRDEAERKEEFAEDVRERREDGEDPRPPDEFRVDFDEDFASRYDYSIVGEDVVNGHRCWSIYLSPRDGDLPVRRWIDNALNNSTGHLWISMDDYGVVRVEFEMARSVRFWFGLLGTLRNTTGRLEFERMADGVWMPTIVDITRDERMLIRSARRRYYRTWEDYTPLRAAD